MKKSTHKITLFITCLLALCLVCGFAMAVPVFAVTSSGNYEVYFDANGGYFDEVSQTVAGPYEIEPGGDNNVFPGTPTYMSDDDHHTLVGWYKGSVGGELLQYAWDSNITSDLTYYAAWEDCYFIKWHLSSEWNSYILPVVYDNYTATKVVKGTTLSEGGYGLSFKYFVPEIYPWDAANECADTTKGFAGWYTQPNGQGDKIDPYSYVPTGDMDLYPFADVNYTITYDGNGGYINGDPNQTTYDEGHVSGSTMNSFPNVETNQDAAFTGWFYDAACTQKVPDEGFTVTGPVTLYAGWGDYWTIKLNAGDQEFANIGQEYVFTKVAKGNSLGHIGWRWNKDTTMMVDSWFKDAALTDPYKDIDGETFVPTSDMTLYAKWTKTANVTLDANGGYFLDVTLTQKATTLEVGLFPWYPNHQESRLVEPQSDDTTRAFLGYYLDQACTKAFTSAADYPETGMNANVTLYAKWGYKITRIESATEGAGNEAPSGQAATYTHGSVANFVATSNAPLEKLDHVEVDGKTVDKSNYEATSGSTIITFKPEFMETLSVGNHIVKIVSTDGEAEAEFEVVEAADESKDDAADQADEKADGGASGGTSDGKSDEKSDGTSGGGADKQPAKEQTSPKTGDPMMAAMAVLAVVAIVAAAGVVVSRKKEY